MLDVHRLRVFRSVVAGGSINAAAAALGYTPSAVSQHVAALQRETGLALITRVGRGIEPTPAGRALAARVDGVLDRLGEVETAVADLRAHRTGSLTLGYFASVGAAWMPHVVRSVSLRFPRLRLSLRLREDLPREAGERLDVQLIVERDGFVPPVGLRAVHLVHDPYVVVLPRGHRLADAPNVELSALVGEPWIDNDVRQGWCRRNLLESCRAAGFSPPFHVETHDYRTAIAFVDAGIGITVLPRLGAIDLPAGVLAVPVTCPTPTRAIHALVSAAAEGTPPVRAVMEALGGCAGAEQRRDREAVAAPDVESPPGAEPDVVLG